MWAAMRAYEWILETMCAHVVGDAFYVWLCHSHSGGGSAAAAALAAMAAAATAAAAAATAAAATTAATAAATAAAAATARKICVRQVQLGENIASHVVVVPLWWGNPPKRHHVDAVMRNMETCLTAGAQQLTSNGNGKSCNTTAATLRLNFRCATKQHAATGADGNVRMAR